MKLCEPRTIYNQTNLYEFERIYCLASFLYGNKEKIVLDFGCGYGYGSFILSKQFKKVFAIDIDDKTIKYCKNKYNLNDNLKFKTISLDSKPFENKYFDFIFSFQVIEHIPIELIKQFIKNIWLMLKIGGTAIITTPNANNYHRGFSGNPFHVREYTKIELESLLKDCIPNNGFKIFAIEDILSTKLSILLKRKFKETIISKILAKIIRISLQPLEKNNILPINYKKMPTQINPEKVIGSFYVEIRK